ncbi:sugar phosphate isomerase/epimerase family protein [Hydrogenophaga sp. BPS33]|uniref:sugar phosphate isomerase/epimerase family protein n=1 Tax=Hydrogenophaga sp. BPS33 TaxID=2651974 RepID=UPI00131FAF78|nr:sugar phosphate isomerase/epimerase [Hydrogenophaga sp. BPS33]QHE86742.1 sugar phosphate isomerase/epimerase [Hydrogenophaga sp. BPS33]
MTRPLSLAALTVLELAPEDRVSCAAEAGFSHIGIRLIPATDTEPRYDLIGDTPRLREVEHRLRDTGVKVLDAEIFRMQPQTRVADLEAAVATAARLGASELLVAGNDADEARLIDTFAAFCELAQRYQLHAALEFMPWTDTRHLRQAAEQVRRSAQPNAGVLVDAFHFSRSRSELADLARVPPSQLRYLQLCDVPAPIPPTPEGILHEARAERLFPGEGGLDLVGLLQAMPAGIPISLEVPTHTLARSMNAVERARRALVATRRLLAQVDATPSAA